MSDWRESIRARAAQLVICEATIADDAALKAMVEIEIATLQRIVDELARREGNDDRTT